MDHIRLIYNDHNKGYSFKESTSLKMDLLARFVAHDLGLSGIDFVKRWILNPKHTWTHTNITTLEKNGDYITLRDLYEEEEEEKDENSCCVIASLQLFHLLEIWEKIETLKPMSVTFICNNNQFDIIAENLDNFMFLN